MLGLVLSVDDIRDGTHWHNALALAQHIEDDYYRDLNEEALRKGEHRPPSKPLVSERILWIPVVPFSVYDGRVYGSIPATEKCANYSTTPSHPAPAPPTPTPTAASAHTSSPSAITSGGGTLGWRPPLLVVTSDDSCGSAQASDQRNG